MWLDFTFNPFALISLGTVILVVCLIGYILRQRYQTATLRWLMVALMVILLWSLAEFFMRISGSAETARLFKYWEMAGYILVGPTAVGFCMAFAGRERALHQWRWLVALFLPAFVFIFAAWTQNFFVEMSSLEEWHRSWYGEWSAPLSNFFTLAFVPWLNILLVIAAGHLWWHFRRQKEPVRRRQSLIILLGVGVPAIVGLLTDQLWQVLTGEEMLELATFTLGVSGLWATYGILKYQLFEVNPAAIATNILATMNEVVVVCTPKFTIEYVSQPAKSLLGYESHELVGQPLSDLIKENWNEIKTLVETGQDEEKSVEVGVMDHKGRVLPVGVSVTPFMGQRGRVLAYVFVLVDLRHLRELLHVTEERNKLQATLRSMTDGVVGITSEGKISLVNQSFCRMLGLNEAGVMNEQIDEVMQIADRHTGKIIQGSLRDLVFQGQKPSQMRLPVIIQSYTGQKVDADIVISRLPEKRKVELGAILTIHNVTKERQLERMKADFTSMAAHELRTPITAIRGYIHVLQDEAISSLSPDHQQVLERIDKSSMRLNRLVERLLEVSAIERGRLRLNKAETDLVAVVTEVAQRYAEMARAENWQFDVTLPPHEVMVQADSERISQVLEILLENAVAFSGDPARVAVIMRNDVQRAVIAVVDNGQGILPELQKGLFEPYSRQATGLRQTKQGAGLSLHIAKSIVELHGGKISVSSEPGKGSVFTVELPVV